MIKKDMQSIIFEKRIVNHKYAQDNKLSSLISSETDLSLKDYDMSKRNKINKKILKFKIRSKARKVKGKEPGGFGAGARRKLTVQIAGRNLG